MSRYLMRFIGGKYEGGVVHLPESGEVGVGRAQELEICLVEDMVSRHHAKLEIHSNKVILTDLGSTNGTFVNGERVQMCELENDDRVLFGTSILRLEDTAVVQANEPQAELEDSPVPTRVVAAEAMSGELSDVSLSDLLQLLSGNGRTGELRIHTSDTTGRVVIQGGQVGHISCEAYAVMAPIKVLSRMLTWEAGRFTFTEGHAAKDMAILGKADELLMEAARQNDEANQLWPQVGGPAGTLMLSRPMAGKLKELASGHLDLVQLTWNHHGALAAMADDYPGEDSAMLMGLSQLLRDGFVKRQS